LFARSPYSQTKLIAEALGFPYIFETIASDSHIDSTYKLANAVISKQPFKEAKAVRLPRPEFLLELPLLPNGQRAEIHDKYMQVLKFENFTLANIHTLPLYVLGSSYGSDDRRTFASEVDRVILEHLSTPLILGGDFNYSDIHNLYPNLFNDLNLLDALPAEPSVPNVDVRIDYVLISKDDFQIVDSFIRPLMTDHYPCWLEFSQSPK
jgi:endonuclease/exonuclease/phosphatase family metal-dependent hydrolase